MIVNLDQRKWVGRPHYRFDTQLLGRDEHGTWLVWPAGTPISGPNGIVTLPYTAVTLVPENRWWLATWYDDRSLDVDLYVDITTVAEWRSPSHVTAVDLDLDIIRRRDGTCLLDDEDEFEEHQIAYGYPAEIVEGARRSADWLLEAIERREEPFGLAGPGWLAKG